MMVLESRERETEKKIGIVYFFQKMNPILSKISLTYDIVCFTQFGMHSMCRMRIVALLVLLLFSAYRCEGEDENDMMDVLRM